MPDAGGPWRDKPAEEVKSTIPRGRVWVWLGFLVAAAALVALLSKLFPGQLTSGGDWAAFAWGIGVVVLVSVNILGRGPIRWGEKARHAAIWAAIVGVLVLGVTYRDELLGVGQRIRGEFSSSYPVATGAHELVVSQDPDGGFYLMGRVNGQAVRFLVDTGASETVLSPADAERIGVDAAGLAFDHPSETANGVGYAAPFTADSLAVGTIRFENMPILVNQAPMSSSLLGMTFLKRLESFRVSGRKLYLKPH
ncbi:MAG: retropepsin-like aspartic protease family protein [Phenylobacterium sp.]